MVPHFPLNQHRSFLIGIILAISFFSSIGIFSFLTISRNEDSAVWVEQSYEAISALQKIPADLRAMESGSRGFLLTHDLHYLSSYRAGNKSIQTDLLRARSLSQDIPDLSLLFNQLDPLVSAKINITNQTVRTCQKGGFDDALNFVKKGPGQNLMNQVDSTISDMRSTELRFLQNRKAFEYANQERELWTLFLSGLAVIVLLFVGGGLFLHQARLSQATALKLLSSEKRFHSLLESTTDSFITTNGTGQIVDVNPATEILFGFAQAELRGQSLEWVLANPRQEGDSTPPFERFLRTAETGRNTGAMELNMKRKDKSEFPAEVSLATWKTDKETFYTIISRDISERKFFTKMLMKNEHRLFQFLEAIPVGIFVLDRLGKPYYANQAAKTLFPKRVDARVPPDQFAEAYHLFRADQNMPYPSDQIPLVRALKGEKSSVDDLEIRDGGNITPLQAWGVPILDEVGKVKYCVGVFLDITERRQNMQALQEREEFFRTLFDDSPIGMTLAFPDATLINVNQSFVRMTGYTKEELLGGTYRNLSHPQDAVVEINLDQKLAQKQIPQYTIEKRILTKGGQPLWCKKSSSLILGVNEEPLFILGIVENIHDQKEAETVLRNSEERFRVLTESINDGIISTDSAGRILFSNPATERIFGYSREELLDMTIFPLMTTNTIQENMTLIQNYLKTGNATLPGQTVEWMGVRKDGQEIPVEVSYFSWKTSQGSFFTGILRDITERKQVEEMKRDLLAVVSHQLKTPVAEINGYIENLLDGVAGHLSEKQREYLTDMREIGVENYRLISDLLNMSKIERGVAAVNLQAVSLWRTLDLSLRDYEATIQRKGLDLRIEKSSRDIELWADQDKTVEALRNIINNALKCTDRGFIALRVREEDDFAVAEIEDTGIGMKPEVLKRLFTKERVMGAEASRSGSGLGLFIARSFMQLQGGDITVESQLGQGSVFKIKIPLVKRSSHV